MAMPTVNTNLTGAYSWLSINYATTLSGQITRGTVKDEGGWGSIQKAYTVCLHNGLGSDLSSLSLTTRRTKLKRKKKGRQENFVTCADHGAQCDAAKE